ncbi:MAG: tetratricopeptide repeat-containing sensor histidine kinase [Cyclobacteriaceae bacterium]
MRILSASLLFLFLLPVYSQKELRDSLINRLEQTRVIDSAYIDILNELSFEFIKSEPAKSLPYINEAIRLADSFSYSPGLVRATSNKGSSFWVVGLQDQALSYYLLALSLSDENNHLDRARLNNNIGEVFKKKKLYDSAMLYYSEAWGIARKILKRKPSIIAYNIAETYLFKGEIDSSSHYYNLGRQFADESGDRRGLAYALFGLAEIKFREGKFPEALELMKESLSIRLQIEDTRGAIQNYLKIADYYLKSNSFNLSSENIQIAKGLSKEINANDLLLEISYLEYMLLTADERYKEASIVLNSYQQLKDSLRTHEFTNTVEKIKSSLLAEISSKENDLLIQEQKTANRSSQSRLMFVITLAVLLIITIGLVYQFREKERMVKHQAEKDLLIDKLRSRNKNLEEFNSVISHNLREPLTQIIGYSKFYENGNTGLNTDEIIGHIKKSSFKIDQTIRDLSTVLNEREPEPSEYRKINLRKAIADILENFDEEIKATGASVSLKIDSEISIKSYGPFLHDIFHHLISNSLRFRSNERTLKLTIEGRIRKKKLTVTIVDNGTGMDLKEVKKKMFRMYQRFDPVKSGRGIGLYLVNNRVSVLSGSISVESEKDGGTTFQITLPIA